MRVLIVLCLLLIAARTAAQTPAPSEVPRNLAVFAGALGSAALTGGLCLGAGRATERDDSASPSPSTPGDGYYDPFYQPAHYELSLEWYAWSAVCYAVLAPFTVAAGASLGGYALEGQGRYWAAAGGVGLGLASALLTTLIASAASDGSLDETHGTAVVSLALLPALGATLFYALSHDTEATRAQPRVMPLASVMDRGRAISIGARVAF